MAAVSVKRSIIMNRFSWFIIYIAPLVTEHCTSIAEVRIWIPASLNIYFQPFFFNCLSCIFFSLFSSFCCDFVLIKTIHYLLLISYIHYWIVSEGKPLCLLIVLLASIASTGILLFCLIIILTRMCGACKIYYTVHRLSIDFLNGTRAIAVK